jgi:hypothetical protein
MYFRIYFLQSGKLFIFIFPEWQKLTYRDAWLVPSYAILAIAGNLQPGIVFGWVALL